MRVLFCADFWYARDHYGDRWLKEMFYVRCHSRLLVTIVHNRHRRDGFVYFCIVHVDFRRQFFRTRLHLVRKIGAEFKSRRRFFGADFRVSAPISGVCVIRFSHEFYSTTISGFVFVDLLFILILFFDKNTTFTIWRRFLLPGSRTRDFNTPYQE